MTNPPDSTPSHPLLNTLHATWLEEEKTRWLESVVEDLKTCGVLCEGVLAPGIWRPLMENGVESFEKLGIDNVLLPSGERIRFALRRDLAIAGGSFDVSSQSAREQLGWEISEEAIAQVNRHLAALASESDSTGDGRGGCVDESGSLARSHVITPGGTAMARRMLFIDEFGRLELIRGGGLTAALELVEKGPVSRYAAEVVIVREALVDTARDRFAPIWGAENVQIIRPDEAGRQALLGI